MLRENALYIPGSTRNVRNTEIFTFDRRSKHHSMLELLFAEGKPVSELSDFNQGEKLTAESCYRTDKTFRDSML